VIDRVAKFWRAAGRGERNCELSVVRITWLGSWDGLHGSFTGCNS